MTTRTAEAFLHNHTFSTTETPIFLRMTDGHPYNKVEIATPPTRVSTRVREPRNDKLI